MSGVIYKVVNQRKQGCSSATGGSSAVGCNLPARALLHLWTGHLLQTGGGASQLLVG